MLTNAGRLDPLFDRYDRVQSYLVPSLAVYYQI